MLATVTYGILVFGIGDAFLPGNPAWATVLLWASSILGAYIANILYLPRVIGMLVAGIMLQNIPWGAIDSFPDKWGVQMRAAALATIFLRCGLELSLETMNTFKFPALRLAIIPGVLEALFDAGLGVAFFNMSYTLALTMGFILKAVGPGLIVPAMFKLQQTGYGTDQAIPSVVVIAASFDDILAITGYAIFSTIAIQPDPGSDESRNTGWSIALGPVQVVFGILGGIIGGTIVGITKVWNTQIKRFLILFFIGLFIMFFFEHWELLSGGALGALFTGLVGSNLWEKGSPSFGSLGPSFVFSPDCERWMSLIWRWIMEPIMFVTVGATLDFSELASGTIPRAIAIVCAGVALRMVFTYISMSGMNYTRKEKIFFSVAWTPKATVQAALSSAPLTLIQSYKVGPDYDKWVTWGNDILTTGLFAIIICGTLGTAAAHLSAPLLLKKGKRQRLDDGTKHQAPQELDDTIDEHELDLEAVPKYQGTLSSRRSIPRAVSTNDALHSVSQTEDDEHMMEVVKRAMSADQISPESADGINEYLIPGEDLSIVAEYIDAIKHLVHAVDVGENHVSRDEVLRLSKHVLYVQKVR